MCCQSLFCHLGLASQEIQGISDPCLALLQSCLAWGLALTAPGLTGPLVPGVESCRGAPRGSPVPTQMLGSCCPGGCGEHGQPGSLPWAASCPWL